MGTQKKTILAVDDNEQILTLYAMVLGVDYHVVTCKTYEELDSLTINPDLVIMDYNIVGEDFNQILEMVNRRFPKAKKILISGYLDTYILDNAISDFTAFIEKPVTMSNLSEAVKGMIEGSRG